jgi:hypothetical protein
MEKNGNHEFDHLGLSRQAKPRHHFARDQPAMAKAKAPKEDPVVEDAEDDDDEDDSDDSDDDGPPDLEEADGTGRGKQSKMEKKSR